MFTRNWLAYAALVGSLYTGVSAAPVLWVGDSDGTLGTVDVATGAATVIGEMPVTMTDIAFDPSGNLWGISFNGLYRIDRHNAATALIGNFGPSLNSLVFGADGTLYAASTELYTLNTSTGAATLVGTGGGYNSGDLAFAGGNLYLTSLGDNLFTLDTATGAGTSVGPIGFSSVFGLATDNNVDLYGVTGTDVIGIDPATGDGTLLTDYAGTDLGAANGSAFLSEAGASAVAEPHVLALLGFALVGFWLQRRRKPG